MTYQVFYGAAPAIAAGDLHVDERIRSERFSTEFEAMRRARELLETDQSTAVAVCDAAGNVVSGIRLQLRLGYLCE